MERRFSDDRFLTLLKNAGDDTDRDPHNPIDPTLLAIKATLVTDKDSIVQLMGSSLPPEEVALVKLSVSNRSGRTCMIRSSDIRLEITDSEILVPSCAPTICSKFEKTTGVTSGLLGPLAGLAAAGGGSRKRTERMIALRKNQLQETTLQNDDSMEGFLYFLIPEEAGINGGAKLAIWVLEPGSVNGTRIHIPITRNVAVSNLAK